MREIGNIQPDSVLLTTFITGCLSNCRVDKALDLIEEFLRCLDSDSCVLILRRLHYLTTKSENFDQSAGFNRSEQLDQLTKAL